MIKIQMKSYKKAANKNDGMVRVKLEWKNRKEQTENVVKINVQLEVYFKI